MPTLVLSEVAYLSVSWREAVRVLKRVVLPTLGRPRIPSCMAAQSSGWLRGRSTRVSEEKVFTPSGPVGPRAVRGRLPEGTAAGLLHFGGWPAPAVAQAPDRWCPAKGLAMRSRSAPLRKPPAHGPPTPQLRLHRVAGSPPGPELGIR